MPERFVNNTRPPGRAVQRETDGGWRMAARLSPESLARARTLIAARLGLDFSESRRDDLERVVLRAWHASSRPTPQDYLAWLANVLDEDPEWGRLAGQLTVGETYFFRDRPCFEALERQILPGLIEARRAEANLRVRLWSAGCSTGEEPYSLAMLLHRLLPDYADWALTILATDVNPKALEVARRGHYRAWALRETPAEVRDRYFFGRGAELFDLDPRIRRMVTFAPLNLAEDTYPSVVGNTNAMDLILCRNVLMYFTAGVQRAVAGRLQRALLAEGWLAVSPSEASAELFRPLAPVNFPGAILFRRAPLSAVCARPAPATAPPMEWRPQPAALELPLRLPTLEIPAWTIPPSEQGRPGGPPDRGALMRRAREMADLGNLKAARALCEAALRKDRLDPDAHLLLAAIAQEQGDVPAALAALRLVLYLAPDSAAAHFLIGTLLLHHADLRRARRHLETVTDLLRPVPRDHVVPGSDGLTAGRLLEAAHSYLQAGAGDRGAGAGDRKQMAASGRRTASR